MSELGRKISEQKGFFPGRQTCRTHLLHSRPVTLSMRFRSILCPILLLITSGPLWSAEPVLQFLEGLRSRGYHDTALQYLDSVSSKSGIPDEVRVILPYERAQILLASAAELNNRDAKRKQLDAAQAALEEFVKGAPTHPLAGQANTRRGEILVQKATVEIWEADTPSNEGSKEKFRDEARNLLAQARRIFEQARDQHQKAWESFPTFIPTENKVLREQRDAAGDLFMKAQLDLAQCTYFEAQTYDRGSAQRSEILTRAALEFEEVHTKYRSQRGGLVARMWQGKCFEEQDETRIALGIYGELLEHPGQSPGMIQLKDTALRFRLICLNHEKVRDYKLVENEATSWLNGAGARARTGVGMGIQWELCRAQEALAQDRNLSEAQKKNILTQALNRARGINRYPGELKAPSSAMIQRLMLALNREPGDPKDFDTAYGQGGQLFDEVIALNETIRKLAAERKFSEIPQQQETLKATAAEMARMFNIALRLIRPDTDPRLADIARTKLAYGLLQQGRYLDAAIIAEFQFLKYSDKSPETAREAGFLAMTAFDYAYGDADPANREFEARKLTEYAQKLADRWPESDRANDARNVVAKIHWDAEDYLQAAEWWLKIPQGTSQYADSRIRAGQAYWRKYILAASLPELERPPETDLNSWKDAAVTQLEAGLAEAEKSISKETPLPDDLVRAKLTLVGIRNMDGIYTTRGTRIGALELLTQQPHPLVDAVTVPAGQERPQDPTRATSREIASLVFQQLLRTQIGLKNLDAARQAREQLEQVSAGQDAAALTQVFVEFGRELQSELERLQASGETDRLNEVRSGFEAFLSDLYSRQEGQSFYSLLWIAETYASLGDGSEDSASKAEEFFDKASATYRSILEKAAGDPLFGVSEQQILACKLRLVNSLRRQKEFAEAETTILEILKTNPNAPDAQFEAARLYQEWGGGASPDDWRRFETALYGKKEPVNVWGWNTTAQMLQRALYGKQDPKLEQLHFDARYNLAVCEREFGKVHPEDKEGALHLQRALTAITGFQRLSKRWPDEQYSRFNSLYKDIQSELGNAVVDLPREYLDAEQLADSQEVSTAVVEPITPEEALAEPKSQSNLPLMLGVLLAGGAAVAGLFYFTLAQGKKKRNYSSTSSGTGKPSAARKGDAAVAPFPGLEGLPVADEPPSFNFAFEESPVGAGPQLSLNTKPQPAKTSRPAETAEASTPRKPAAGTSAERPRTARPATPGEGPPVAKTPRPRPPEGTTEGPPRPVAKEGTPLPKRPATPPEEGSPKKSASPPAGGPSPAPRPRPRPPVEGAGEAPPVPRPRPKSPPEEPSS